MPISLRFPAVRCWADFMVLAATPVCTISCTWLRLDNSVNRLLAPPGYFFTPIQSFVTALPYLCLSLHVQTTETDQLLDLVAKPDNLLSPAPSWLCPSTPVPYRWDNKAGDGTTTSTLMTGISSTGACVS